MHKALSTRHYYILDTTMIEKKAMVPAFMKLTPLWERTDICQQNYKRQCTMTTSNTAMQERTWDKKAYNRTDTGRPRLEGLVESFTG